MIFPIIALKERDPMIYAFAKESEINRTTTELLKKKVFNNTFFFDASGEKFSIKKVIEKGWATPFWGYSILWKGRLVKIDFELQQEGFIELEELKNLLLEKIEKSKNYLLKELIPYIKTAKDYYTLYNLFCKKK